MVSRHKNNGHMSHGHHDTVLLKLIELGWYEAILKSAGIFMDTSVSDNELPAVALSKVQRGMNPKQHSCYGKKTN